MGREIGREREVSMRKDIENDISMRKEIEKDVSMNRREDVVDGVPVRRCVLLEFTTTTVIR